MSLEDLLEDLEQTEKEIGQEETIDSSSGAGQGGAGTGGLFGSTTFTGSTAQSLADGFGQSGSGLFEGGSSMFGNDVDLPDQGDDPFETGGIEDDVFEMLYAVMSGRQGVPEGTSEELLSALESVLAGANQDQIEAIAQQIIDAGGFEQWLASQEEEDTDIFEDTTEGDTTAPEGDTTTTQEEEESGGIWGAVRDWWNSVSTGGTTGGGSMPFPGPGVGVEIDIDQVFSPGNWRVFLPGVIPGLPQSNTIIGTIEEILSDPSNVLGDLWNTIQETASDPMAVLEDLLNNAADSEGLITIGGMSGVVGALYDEYFDQDSDSGEIEIETEEDLPLGGDYEVDPSQTPDFPGGEAPIPDQEDDPIGGAEDDDSPSTGGGGGGGAVASRPSFGEFTPFMRRLQYQPVAVPKAIVPDAPIVSSLFEEFLK